VLVSLDRIGQRGRRIEGVELEEAPAVVEKPRPLAVVG